jgi:hypothetical protein
VEDVISVSPEIISKLKEKLANARTEEDVKMVIGPFIDNKAEVFGFKSWQYKNGLEISGEKVDELYAKVIARYRQAAYLTKMNFRETCEQAIGYVESFLKKSSYILSNSKAGG